MGGLKQSERVLIHAAAGGVGISATQVAKGIGAEIFGTASASKHDAIREQGVDHAIDYRNARLRARRSERITGGEGVDVIMDALGPTSFRKDYRLLRPGGRLIMYGLSEVQSGTGKRDIPAAVRSLARMPLATMPWWKSLWVMNENKGVFGLNMLHWWDAEGGLDRALEPLLEGLEKGDLKPVVAEAFPFDRAAGRAPLHRGAAQHRQGRAGPLARRPAAPLRWPLVLVPVLASIGSVYDRAIVDTGRQAEFLFFVSFLVTFGFIRTSAHMIRAQVSWWPGNVEVGGTHIHHLVWGICLLLIWATWASRSRRPRPGTRSSRCCSGSAPGLTLDEFALWLNLKDVYWSQQGRRSIDAVIIAATITGMVLVGFTAWLDVATEVEDAVFAVVGAFGVLAILFALVNLAKEKFGMAAGRFLLPPGGPRGRLPARESLTRCGRACSIASTKGARPPAVRRAQPRAGCSSRPTDQSAAGSG